MANLPLRTGFPALMPGIGKYFFFRKKSIQNPSESEHMKAYKNNKQMNKLSPAEFATEVCFYFLHLYRKFQGRIKG